MDGLEYLPNDEIESPGPLARYLPLAENGIVEKFIKKHLDPGSWVLDPFGASPRTAIEMVLAGCRLLVAVNNPVTHFLLETSANPPAKAVFRTALAELAASRKGNERIETHIQALYLTSCSKCLREVPAEAFIWDRESGKITGRIYHCPCGESGEFPATETDQVHAAKLAATDSLHRARALERVAGLNDPDRGLVEAALECYLPRAIYALVTIMNKLDTLPIDLQHRRALHALLLTACDESSSLWSHGGDRTRPKLLVIPQRFLEKNLWMSLEKGVDSWQFKREAVPVAHWPAQPVEENGLCIFQGPLRELTPQLKQVSIQGVITVLPRPNQAFWTLSAIWSGWLWGRELAASFKPALHRRRYDWHWHAEALSATMDHLPEHLPLNAPLFGIMSEPEPGFLSAALLAAAASGYNLSGIAMRTRHDPVQFLWNKRAFSVVDKEQPETDNEFVIQMLLSFLKERGEPAPYLHLLAAGLSAMAKTDSLPLRNETGRYQFADAISQLNTTFETAFASPLLRHYSDFSNPESGTWGLSEWDRETESLPDRVEMAVVHFLLSHPNTSLTNIEEMLYSKMTGLNTPSKGLIQAAIDSYAIEAEGSLNLRPEDDPSSRRRDLESISEALSLLAKRWKLTISRQESPIRHIRLEESNSLVYVFYMLVSAKIREILMLQEYPADRSVLLFPGGRANLVAYKLSRDPALKALTERWRLVTFRSLLRLAEMNDLSIEDFDMGLRKEVIEPPTQMKLL